MYEGACIDQVQEFEYLRNMLHGTKDLGPALEYLCKAAKRAISGHQCKCQQLIIHDLMLQFQLLCKLFDTLVKPILCYCCEVWSIHECRSALESLKRSEVGFMKVLLGIQVCTKTLHVLAEFWRRPSALGVAQQTATYLMKFESVSTDMATKQAFLANCRLPGSDSWRARVHNQLHDFFTAAPT